MHKRARNHILLISFQQMKNIAKNVKDTEIWRFDEIGWKKYWRVKLEYEPQGKRLN